MDATTTPPWKKYKRKAVPAEMYPWVEGEDLALTSVGEEDVSNGSPKKGDMIARDPSNHSDQWLVNAEYFGGKDGKSGKFDTTPLGMGQKDAGATAAAALDTLIGDSEAAHGEAEDILFALLREKGLGQVADAFERAAERLTFWYA